MLVRQAVICGVAAGVIGVGGGVAAARVGHHTEQPSSQPRAGSPGSTSPTPSVAPSTSGTPTPVDRLSEENLIRERLYYDVTGHSFSVVPVDADPNEPLGPCTGDTTFSDVLPKSGLTQIETILAGGDSTRVTQLVAQTRTAQTARSAADRIVTMVEECPGVPGGDFGYGDPVTLSSDASQQVVYFPGYDSDRRYGGYIVFSVGNRVGVVSVSDQVGAQKVAHLAKEAASIAGI